MTFPKARLVVSLCLFLSWLGFLGYLVAERRTIVLSGPQFLIAQAVIVAEVRDDHGQPDPIATVKQVEWSVDEAHRPPVGKSLHLHELPDCGRQHGYRGAGEYVIPLLKHGDAVRIAPVPTGDVRIYQWTPDTRAQMEEIVKKKKG